MTGGGGTALIKATSAVVAAAVIGAGTGATTLEITTVGTVTLNAADTYLTMKLDGASKLTLSGMGFITADGSNGGGTLTAKAANQTLIGGALDTLTGFPGGGDTFLGTSAGLNGDTIGNWTIADVIDLTDMNSTTLQSLAYAAGSKTGMLTVKDGNHPSAIKFSSTTFSASNFVVIGSDGHGETLIGYHG